jgi:hypothetical protein
VTDAIHRIEGAPAIGGEAGPAEPPPSISFRRLMESLERLAGQQRAPEKVQDAEQLREALRAADDDFVTAMDLRKRLEEVFRSRLP